MGFKARKLRSVVVSTMGGRVFELGGKVVPSLVEAPVKSVGR